MNTIRTCRILVIITTLLNIATANILADQLPLEPTHAVEMKHLLDLRADINPSLYESFQNNSLGAVYFPDKVLTYDLPLPEDSKIDNLIQQWSESHRFIAVPFIIAIRPNDDRIPKVVDVTLDLTDDVTRSQLMIHDLFPSTRFRKAPMSGSVALRVNGRAKFELMPKADGTIEGDIGLTYTYSPAYADVLSGNGSSHAFWKFSRTQESSPVGNIPMKVILAIPKVYKENEIVGRFDVRVEFPGWMAWGNSVTANFETLFQLP